jgi:DNA-binding PadR family transcriptional regulator
VRPALLALLAEGPKHGYQLIQELAERTDGRWRASPGSVYPTLQQLEDEGLVRAEEMDGKRVFHLTDAGRELVDARTGPPPWEQLDDADDAAGTLMDGVKHVAVAATQVASAGTEAQQTEAARVLADTRRALYRILAEDDA